MAINLDHVTEQITVTDTAANADLTLVTKGTGAVNVNTANGLALKITDAGVGTIENYWRVEGRNISGSPTMYVEGAGTNINTIFTTKGAGSHNFTSQGSRSNTQFQISSTTSAVNYLQATGQPAGFGPLLSSQGSDTNINMVYMSKGTGGHAFGTGGGSYTQQLFVSHTVSAVNYVQVTGSSTGNDPTLSVQGSDTNINFAFVSKGSSIYTFASQGGSSRQFRIDGTSASVNYLNVSGSGTGSAPALSALGTDTNIDLTLTPKGTGNVRFGTYTGTILTPTGYVEIKDSGGTVRRLLVG